MSKDNAQNYRARSVNRESKADEVDITQIKKIYKEIFSTDFVMPEKGTLFICNEETGETIVGFLVAEDYQTSLFISCLTVSTEMWGQGIEKKLLKEATTHFSSPKIKTIFIEIHDPESSPAYKGNLPKFKPCNSVEIMRVFSHGRTLHL